MRNGIALFDVILELGFVEKTFAWSNIFTHYIQHDNDIFDNTANTVITCNANLEMLVVDTPQHKNCDNQTCSQSVCFWMKEPCAAASLKPHDK